MESEAEVKLILQWILLENRLFILLRALHLNAITVDSNIYFSLSPVLIYYKLQVTTHDDSISGILLVVYKLWTFRVGSSSFNPPEVFILRVSLLLDTKEISIFTEWPFQMYFLLLLWMMNVFSSWNTLYCLYLWIVILSNPKHRPCHSEDDEEKRERWRRIFWGW